MAGENYIKFLGTAGARYVVGKQLRSSGGTYLHLEGKSIILDPGPGTLVRCANSRPPIDVTKLDAIILTHAHIDHSGDINILIDSMTGGGLKKRGLVFAPDECIHGKGAVIFYYLRKFPDEIVAFKPSTKYGIGELTFTTSARHKHPVETYGITFKAGRKHVSFIVDTEFTPELIESYRGSDILVMNVVRKEPHASGEVMHLSIEDVRRIIREIRPEKVIMTHFGMTMLQAKPWELARELSTETGVEVLAASDGMKVLI